ncbi:hypothetical protein LUZ60_016901 [Juncus effusus]|nr:hypothetical protein LUZ60_016901 [Juncus effusus]
MAEYRDWASIPPDLILIILKNLHDLGDFIRFHAVCAAWRSAVLHSPYPPPFLPVLIDHCNYWSVIEGKSDYFWCRVPGMKVSGPSHGRLLGYDQNSCQLSVFNPVNGKEVELPPLELDWNPGASFFHSSLIENREIVVISTICGTTVYFWSLRVGLEKKWSKIEHTVQMEGAGNVYFKGKYYVNESLDGPTAVIDPSSGNVLSVIPPPKDRNLHHEDWKNYKAVDYLVESNGKLLRIFRFYDIFYSVENCYFEIHRLDCREGKSLNWVKTGDLGDQMLFLDKLHGISKSCDGIKGARGNCIYFTKYQHFEDLGWSGILCRFDVGKRKAEVLPGFLETRGSWVVPSLF